MANIHSIRSSMLRFPDMWKGDDMIYEVVKIITSTGIIFFPGEDWAKIYNNFATNNNFGVFGTITNNLSSRVRILVPNETPIINPNNKNQLKELIRLAGIMSFCNIKSEDFNNARWYNNEAYLPEGSDIQVSSGSTFSRTILNYMHISGSKISVDIFNIIINDTKLWFQSIIKPTSVLRNHAVSRIFENHGLILGDDIAYILSFKRLFSNHNDCIKNLITEVNKKIDLLIQADHSYLGDYMAEKEFCEDIFDSCVPWLNENNRKINDLKTDIFVLKDAKTF